MKKDYYQTKCFSRTSIPATVKNKEIKSFLRYNDKTGSARNDEHYETTFAFPDGTEVTSYSKKLFANTAVGKKIDLDVSFCKMPNGKTLLFV